ncbi:hypothetical protein ABW20_dc0109992 [Dactylellina cionopaga]|nr:hypothetical protein ABW20_dc0109992 [Dactylellina cionopaga]
MNHLLSLLISILQSTPTGSLRLRQKASLSESLNGLKSGLSSQPLSKKPSFASGTGSFTGSQRLHFRQSRAEAVFDQTTPFSTIRLMMSRAAASPNDPAPAHLFRQIMDYFGTDDDQMVSILQNQQQKSQQQENRNGVGSPAGLDTDTILSGYSGTLTPTGDSTPSFSTPRELSNAEIMVYIGTMLGHLPRNAPEGVLSLEQLFAPPLMDIDEDGLRYVSDCEPCDDGGSVGGDENAGDYCGGNGDHTGFLGEGRNIREAPDENYDMDL